MYHSKLMSYRARSNFEIEILEKFDEKLEGSDEVSEDVVGVISDSLEETTLSQSSAAAELAEQLIERRTNESE